MKRRSIYTNMTASDLARVTRERGLEKPNVKTLSEWADFLEADDATRRPQSPEFEIIDAIGTISVPEDTAANLVVLVSVLAQKAGLDVDAPAPEGDEALDLISRLTHRLAAALPEVELIPTQAAQSDTGAPATGEDGDRDEENADIELIDVSDSGSQPVRLRPDDDTPPASEVEDTEAPTPTTKRPKPPSTKG